MIQFNSVLLAPFTTFKIGGKVKSVFICENASELLSQVDRSDRYIILGGGSNVLFSSLGYDGNVIINQSNDIEICGDLVKVDSGVSMAKLSKFYLDNAFVGLAWACSVPGSVGGAVKGNSGAFGGCIADVVEFVEVFTSDGVKVLNTKDCCFGYRFSKLDDYVILRVWLKAIRGEQNDILFSRQDFKTRRKKSQPGGKSAGSIFKAGQKPAGWYIDNAGLKGMRVGGAVVSEKHANFIINESNATSDDVLNLISIIKHKVYDIYKVEIKEEIKILGDF